MRLLSHLIIVSSALVGSAIPRIAFAATSAKLSVSAIVMTRCNIRVRNLNAGRISTESTCSDSTQPTVLINSADPTEGGKAPTTEGKRPGTGGADVTITY